MKARSLTLADVYEGLTGLRPEGLDQRITTIVIDSRHAKPGALFVAFAGEAVQLALNSQASDVDSLLADDGGRLEEARKELIAKIGENITVRRFEKLQAAGEIGQYTHGTRIGVIVDVIGGDDELRKDIAMHIAAAAPAAISRDQIDPALVAKEKEIAAEQVKDKPAQAIPRIVEGKLEKYFQTVCLVDQGFIKRNSEVTVKEQLAALAKQVDDEIKVLRFLRYQVGEVTG